MAYQYDPRDNKNFSGQQLFVGPLLPTGGKIAKGKDETRKGILEFLTIFLGFAAFLGLAGTAVLYFLKEAFVPLFVGSLGCLTAATCFMQLRELIQAVADKKKGQKTGFKILHRGFLVFLLYVMSAYFFLTIPACVQLNIKNMDDFAREHERILTGPLSPAGILKGIGKDAKQELDKNLGSGVKMSDKLEDFTFEIDGSVYQLPISYKEIKAAGFTPDTPADHIVPAGEGFWFRCDYLSNEYSNLSFGALNNTDHDMKLGDLDIIAVHANQFRWNKYKIYPFRMAGGIEIMDSYISDVQENFEGVVPTGETENVMGSEFTYYAYHWSGGEYEFFVQPNGLISGICIIKYYE